MSRNGTLYGDENVAFRALRGLFVGVPIGFSMMTVANSAIALVRLPRATLETYKMLWRLKTIGPILKTTLMLVTPVAVLLAVPLVCVASMLAGVGFGFYEGAGNSISVAIREIGKWIRRFDREMVVDGIIKNASEYNPDLAPGKEPFDIRILDGIRGLVAAFTVGLFEAALLTLVVIRWWPQTFWKLMFEVIWSKEFERGFSWLIVKCCLSVLLVVLMALVIPLTPIAAMCYGAGYSCYKAYSTRSIRAAHREGMERARDLYDLLRGIVSGKD